MQAQAVQHRVHVLHSHAADQNIGSAVVAHGNHHGGKIAQRQARDSQRKAQHDVTAGDQILLANHIFFSEFELALLRL